MFAGSADDAFTSDVGTISASSAPSSPITSGDLLSTVLSHLLSLVIDDTFLSAVFGHILSFVAVGGLLSAVFDCFLSFIASSGLLSAVFGYFLSLITDSSPISAISGVSSLFFIFPTDFWALFLMSILSSARHFLLPSLQLFYSFLPSLPTLLTRNSTPFT